MRTSRAWILAGLAVAAATVAVGLLAAGHTQADASTLSRGGAGWLAARRYLEERGTGVVLLDRAPEETPTRGLLVLALPWQVAPGFDFEAAVHQHLDRGGDVLFAYSGTPLDTTEDAVARALDLSWSEVRPRPPLNPLRFRAWAEEEWDLAADASLEDVRPLRMRAPRRVPDLPAGAHVLLRAERRALPVAFRFALRRGGVTVVPADTLSNGRIAEPGSADLLEALRRAHPEQWTIDEYHHGLQATVRSADGDPEHVFTLLVVQLVFVYGLVVLARVRRFGAPWREPPVTAGSAAAYLVGLGAVHQRLGHHREAGALLVRRATELDGRIAVEEQAVGSGDALLALAQTVGRAQSGRGTA